MSILDMARRVEGVYREMKGRSELPVIVGDGGGDSKTIRALEYSVDRLKALGFELSGNMDDEIKGTLRCAEVLIS